MGRISAFAATACAMTLAPGSAHAEWMQAESKHFQIIADNGNKYQMRMLAGRLEKLDFLLRRVTGTEISEQSGPVRVFMLADKDKVPKIAGKKNISGYYGVGDRFAFAVMAEDGAGEGYLTQEILFHEYTHHFMLHYAPAAYPNWYIEGFAEYFSVLKFPKDGGVSFGHIPQFRANGLLMGRPYPLRKLLAEGTEKLSREDGDRYYGTAWLLMHYFRSRPDRQQEITRYLMDFAAGKAVDLDSYFVGGVDGLEKDLHRYMGKALSFSILNDKDITVGDIAISPYDPVRGALVESELRMMRAKEEEDFQALVNPIGSIAAKFPQSAYAQSVLAEVQAGAGANEDALATADRAIAMDPAQSRAHSVRARILLDRAKDSGKDEDWKAARSAIVKANRADVNDPVPLELFYRYHMMRGGTMPQLGYDGIAKAFALLPQNPGYRFAWAQAKANQGDYAAASHILDPVAYSPHNQALRDEALKMKAQFDSKAKGQKPLADARTQ